MVTIVAAALVSAATFSFFAGQQRIYEIQGRVLDVQQSLWASMDVVTRYARAAGVGMLDCIREDSDEGGPDIGDPPPGGDLPPQTGIRAYRAGIGLTRIAPLWIQNGQNGAPDTLTVAYGRRASGNFVDSRLGAPINQDQPTSPVITWAGETPRFWPNDFILLVDGGQANRDRGCTLLQITNIDPATNTLSHGAQSPWNPGENVPGLVPFTYDGGESDSTGGIRTFGELVWVQLAVDRSGGPDAPPRLTMDRLNDGDPPQTLAAGIEDMQISYACDTGPGGFPNGNLDEGTDDATRLGDEWIFNQAGDAVVPGCLQPDAIRITLIARTVAPDPLLADLVDNAKPAAEDGAPGAGDQFRHRTLTVTVRRRN